MSDRARARTSRASVPHPWRARAAGAVARVAVPVAVALFLTGCRSGGRAYPASNPPAPPARPPADAERVSEVRAPGAPTGSIVGSAARLDFRTLGTVATDGCTLPIFSPDGRRLAVQTGVVPDEATALARPGQRPPRASRIAIYQIEGRSLTRLGETEAGLVLGRSADARGFLVESPRPDGSRWIGRIDWGSAAGTGGEEPEWLVQDGQVNAFAALGPAGELAYATRDVRERRFDLVVRRDGVAARLSGDGIRSYLFPTFSADGARLLAIAVRDGIAELTDLDPRSSAAMEQSLVRMTVSDRADDRVAAQMIAPQGARDATLGDDWLVFHPALGTLVRWRGGMEVRPIPGGAVALGRVDDTRIAVLAGGSVRVRAVDPAAGAGARDPGTLVIDGVAVPRRSDAVDGAPSVILVIPEPNGIRLVLVRVLPA